MIWIIIYVVGMLATAVLSGYLKDRDSEVDADDSIVIFFASMIWPILLMIGIFGGLAGIGQKIKNEQKK